MQDKTTIKLQLKILPGDFNAFQPLQNDETGQR